MSEKFDKYYEYFVKKERGGVKPRRIDLGIVSIDLKEGRVDIRPLFRRQRAGGIAVVDGESIRLRGRVADVKGKYVVVKNARLELVEGEHVELLNAKVRRAAGKYVVATNCKVDEVEAEELTMNNAVAGKVVATRGRFNNCVIGKLVYKEHYEAANTLIGHVEKA